MTKARAIAACAAVMVVALFVVGVVSGGVLRHLIQTFPLIVVTVLGARWAPASLRWLAAPLFLIWLLIMGLIWAFLIGLDSPISGHFSLTEVAMTIIVGLAALFGLAASFYLRAPTGWLKSALVFIATAALQIGLIALSLTKPISTDAAVLQWIGWRF